MNAPNSNRSLDLCRCFQFVPSADLGDSPIVNLEMCGGRVEVSGALRTRMDVATEFVVIGDLIGSSEAQEDGIVGETPMPQPAPPRSQR